MQKGSSLLAEGLFIKYVTLERRGELSRALRHFIYVCQRIGILVTKTLQWRRDGVEKFNIQPNRFYEWHLSKICPVVRKKFGNSQEKVQIFFPAIL